MVRIIFFLLFQVLYFHLNGQNQSNSTTLYDSYLSQELMKDSKTKTNPPLETGQFDFLIGTFDCIDSTFINGDWETTVGTWTSKYIQDGFWIKSKYITDQFFQSSIRCFISEKNSWDIHFSNFSKDTKNQWEGKKEGAQLVISQIQIGPNGACNEHRIIFKNISKEGFDWTKETIDLHTGKKHYTHIIHATKRKDFSFAN